MIVLIFIMKMKRTLNHSQMYRRILISITLFKRPLVTDRLVIECMSMDKRLLLKSKHPVMQHHLRLHLKSTKMIRLYMNHVLTRVC